MLDKFVRERIIELNNDLRAINQDIMHTIMVEDRGESEYCRNLKIKADSIMMELDRIDNALKIFKEELKDFVQIDEGKEKRGQNCLSRL
jgi:hypothetical protein